MGMGRKPWLAQLTFTEYVCTDLRIRPDLELCVVVLVQKPSKITLLPLSAAESTTLSLFSLLLSSIKQILPRASNESTRCLIVGVEPRD